MSVALTPAWRLQERIAATQRRPGGVHVLLIVMSAIAAIIGAWCWSIQIRRGLVVSGLNRPVGWAIYITNFVFWVGIAHSGTLISAVLYLLRARFRTAVYRVAEAMTVFGVMTAGLFPIIHLGRPWLAYWLFPYPNERHLWVNFKSPLMWDVFAVSTYFIVSTMFLLVGIIPDAAALRDAAQGWRRRFYAVFAAGWRGTDEEWRHYARVYLYFAAFATPLVFSVHSVVSWDFAVSILPGWHSTLFPPYFVAGAILSGMAMVLTLLVPLRRSLHLEDLITPWHLGMVARVLLFTSLLVTYSYTVEYWLALTGGASAERSTLVYRAVGDYAPMFWTMVLCNCIVPLFIFFERVRRSPWLLFAISILVNIGMWTERFVIIITSLAHERMPFDWHTFRPTWIEAGMTLGAFGMFFTFFLIFVCLLPAVSISEMKETLGEEGLHAA